MLNYLSVNPEVAHALTNAQPVVALESTIITHGMPWPQNLEMAASVEAVIRDEGAVPATIAVLDGCLTIGLSNEQRIKLAQDAGKANSSIMKLSRADIGFAISEGKTGGTTVAATMIAAQIAGISVFATGGIGGVHRGAETSFDISADLEELAKTSVIVVSAGPKAILDLPKTLEVLETHGVPVIGFKSDDMPAFWSRKSGLKAPLRLDTASDIARLYRTRKSLGLEGGILITNPVLPEDEIPFEEMYAYLLEAENAANANGVSGKDVTPFLLGYILEITGGRSLKTNIELVKNNARLAAKIAGELS